MANGYVYVLTNPAIPNLAKVGMTTRNPADRILELSAATGVPSPFILIFQQPVLNPEASERWVHHELDLLGYRHSIRREFFTGPLHEIVRIVSAAATVDLQEQSSLGYSEGVELPAQDMLAEDLYQMALAVGAGSDFRAPNHVEAVRFYEQAALMGHIPSTLKLAEHKSISERLQIYEKLVKKGVLIGLWHAAKTHLSNSDRPRAMRMFDEFFNKSLDQLGNSSTESEFAAQFRQCAVSYGLLVLGYENADGLTAETARKALPQIISAIRARIINIQDSALPRSKERYELDSLLTVQDGFHRRLEALAVENL